MLRRCRQVLRWFRGAYSGPQHPVRAHTHTHTRTYAHTHTHTYTHMHTHTHTYTHTCTQVRATRIEASNKLAISGERVAVPLTSLAPEGGFRMDAIKADFRSRFGYELDNKRLGGLGLEPGFRSGSGSGVAGGLATLHGCCALALAASSPGQ